jgi:hypothetical protein
MRPRLPVPIAAACAALFAAAMTHAQEPWIDAGQQHMLMHQGDLLEQQTAPNNEPSDTRDKPKPNADTPDPECSMAQQRERLRPEYERRVRAEGRQAANAWLRREAAALGRQAAQAGEHC